MFCTSLVKTTPTGETIYRLEGIDSGRVRGLLLSRRCIERRWQARREGDRNMRAGLIPSRALQERRILLERQQKEKPDEDNISMSNEFVRAA